MCNADNFDLIFVLKRINIQEYKNLFAVCVYVYVRRDPFPVE